uniref:OCRE domain-containing protein n=1 Tax=Ananas comosus var. bracteatus TaxID=296719 RepID=A0A6V7P6D0_ANACO|nr:unnamed protein product [Ananas comosus var. bracteatus]
MEETGRKSSRPTPKRPLALSDDDDSDRHRPEERRERFPKGKKPKKGDSASAASSYGGDVAADDLDSLMNPEIAAKQRAKRRKLTRQEEPDEVFAAEVHYEDDVNFVDDGIQIEPFNLEQEREEGYFDANGNFVEYRSKNEIKDAWLDSVEVDTRFARKVQEKTDAEDNYHDLSSEEVGKMKRNIANILQAGETIIQALKRLKGTSTDKRGKMSDVTKQMFDQLTEHAMKLMEHGEYNVYHEERETFVREAEGYERLARARGGSSGSTNGEASDSKHVEDIFCSTAEHESRNSSIWDIGTGSSAANISTLPVSSSDGNDKFDMFGDDDDDADANLQSDPNATGSASTSEVPVTNSGGSEASDGGLGSDYVYDPSSGYYYSSSLGYYYDPTSGLYCSASTGTWYSFDEQSGSYKEIQSAAASES